MRLKLFRAAHVAEAMARVRAELGADALILGTRAVAGGIEVTAALETADVPEPIQMDRARIAVLEYHAIPTALAQALETGALETAIAQTLRFALLPLERDARPLLLVGPPGAGKTLTCVRLATRLVMAGTQPLVITVDAKRAGATEQLEAFTRVLGVRLTVADDPIALGRAVSGRSEGSPVFIDACGTDPFDPAQADEMRTLAGAANATIALVLPAGLDVGESIDLAHGYAAIGARFLIATRLDLARRLGGILAASDAEGLPLTEAGIGPNAADGLIPLTPAWLGRRLMKTGTRS